MNLPEGLLIYCQHDKNAPPQQVIVRNLGTRLGTWAISLDRTTLHLEQELKTLANHIARRVQEIEMNPP
jgi:hypothetical protein